MAVARDSFTKASKPKKGQAPKITKGLIIYRDNFQPYQIDMLRLLKSLIVNGQIRADWRTEVKIENKQ